MKNADKISREFVHLYLALRRKKENPDLQPMCFREIIIDPEVDLLRLKTRIDNEEGIWRIHKTVNKRDCKKACKVLMKKLIDDPELAGKIPSLWKTCLMQPAAKGERMFLLDVDREDSWVDNLIADLSYALKDFDGTAIEHIKKTPHGYHLVTQCFDTRILSNIPDVTIKRDGYLFLELYESVNNKEKGNEINN